MNEDIISVTNTELTTYIILGFILGVIVAVIAITFGINKRR